MNVDESEHMRAALLTLINTPVDLSDISTEEIEKAVDSLLRIIGISLDPTPNWYNFARETIEFRDHDWFRYFGFSSFTKWCERYNFSPRTISGYRKTFNDLSVDRAIDLEVYEHLSPSKVEKLMKPLLATEPNRLKGESGKDVNAAWDFWSLDLISILKGAK